MEEGRDDLPKCDKRRTCKNVISVKLAYLRHLLGSTSCNSSYMFA
jgi:hypothetical protein